MNRTSQRKARGFTLLEVIVAVVIAALCLSALAQVFATGVRAAGTASDYTRAVTLAQSLLAGAGVEKALEDGAEGGTTADGKLAWTLTVTQEPTEDADAPVRPPLDRGLTIRRGVIALLDATAPSRHPSATLPQGHLLP